MESCVSEIWPGTQGDHSGQQSFTQQPGPGAFCLCDLPTPTAYFFLCFLSPEASVLSWQLEGKFPRLFSSKQATQLQQAGPVSLGIV